MQDNGLLQGTALAGNLILEHWRCSLLLSLALVPLLTFVITSAASLFGRYSTREGREPPLKPYWIPYLGDFFNYLLARQKLVENAYLRFGSTPLTVRLGPAKAYLMLQPESFPALLRDSRACTNKVFSVLLMRHMFGSPKHAMHVYNNDNSGVGATPLPGTDVPAKLRIWHHQHKSNARYLGGDNLKQLSNRTLELLSAELASTNPTDETGCGEWVTIPDFNNWWLHKLTVASVTASFGPHLLRLNPDFVEDFWEYLDEWPSLASFYPRWLAPKGYRARDRVLEGIKRWHAFARQHSSDRAGPNDPLWDDYWGSTWHKVRQQWGQDTGEWDDDALAAEDLALLVAANANLLPMCFWNVIQVFSDPDLLASLEDEYKACIVPPTSGEPQLPLRFDITKILESPLPQSIYAEGLRMRVVMFHNRSPNLADYRLGSFTLRKGGIVTLPSMIASHDARLWGAARTAEGRPPLGTFWAERFLVPDKGKSSSETISEGKALDEKKTRFSTEGLEGAWTPFGGGSFICPGRHLAKRLIIGSAAVFAAYFDMEATVPHMDNRFYGMGTQPPEGRVSVRIRRKLGVGKPQK